MRTRRKGFARVLMLLGYNNRPAGALPFRRFLAEGGAVDLVPERNRKDDKISTSETSATSETSRNLRNLETLKL